MKMSEPNFWSIVAAGVGSFLTYIGVMRKVNADAKAATDNHKLSRHESWREDFKELYDALKEENKQLRQDLADLKAEMRHEIQTLRVQHEKERQALITEIETLRKTVNHFESLNQ